MQSLKMVLYLALVCVMLGISVAPARSAPNAILTVNVTSDLSDNSLGDGICDVSANPGAQCSLRAAIEEVNALGAVVPQHRIEFNLTGTGPFTISPTSALPSISVPVTIDGTTQSGATCTTVNAPASLQIVLDGSSAGSGVTGLHFNTGSDGSIVGGLVIGNFTTHGILIGSDSSAVYCSFIGIGADGTSDIGNNNSGIFIYNFASDINVGGTNNINQRNVISFNNSDGIRIQNASNVLIQNNFIGTDSTGLTDSGNGFGIYLLGTDNTIGGTSALSGNLISGNSVGIRINSGQNNSVYGNWIGLAADGSTALPNSSNGIEVLGDSFGNLIGGTANGQANLIVNNGLNGIVVALSSLINPVENPIRGNRIANNIGLGIDLGNDGVDSNDAGDSDSGDNLRQNYPVLQTSTTDPEVLVSLDSLANTQFTLDFYRNSACDPSGYGEGESHIFTTTLTTDALGYDEINLDLTSLTSYGDFITATATDPDGNTSEFSACAQVIYTSSQVFLPLIINP